MSRHVVRVRAASRLHFGLLSLGGATERQFGGVGVMVDAPGLTLALGPAERLSATGPLAERAMHFARQFAAAGEPAGKAGEPACQIEIESAPPEHVGLGTGTQLGLAVAAGVSALAAAKGGTARGSFAVSEGDAVRWARQVGRGERSAIGTHGFARGGLLVEGGKRAAGAVSALISRLELPDAWRFVLLVDRDRQGLSGASERRAFADLPPTPAEFTASLCREVLVDLLPAAAEGDFDAFAESLYRFGHEAGLLFAQRQGGAYAAGLQTELVAWLRGRGVRGVGQSSWGPTIFALARDADQAAGLAADVGRQFSASRLSAIIAAPANRGATFEYVGQASAS
jgi:beta-ribofuranosylaminobenzene 5'-phosphate synthase